MISPLFVHLADARLLAQYFSFTLPFLKCKMHYSQLLYQPHAFSGSLLQPDHFYFFAAPLTSTQASACLPSFSLVPVTRSSFGVFLLFVCFFFFLA